MRGASPQGLRVLGLQHRKRQVCACRSFSTTSQSAKKGAFTVNWKAGPCPSQRPAPMPSHHRHGPLTPHMEAPLPGQPCFPYPLPRKLQFPSAQHQSQARISWGGANRTALNEESSTAPQASFCPGSWAQHGLLLNSSGSISSPDRVGTM
jgi:hypothetical protein